MKLLLAKRNQSWIPPLYQILPEKRFDSVSNIFVLSVSLKSYKPVFMWSLHVYITALFAVNYAGWLKFNQKTVNCKSYVQFG